MDAKRDKESNKVLLQTSGPHFERIAFVLLSALALGLPLVFFPGASSIFDLAKASYLQVIAVLLITGLIVHMLTRGRFLWRSSSASLPLIFLFLALLVSTILSRNPAISTVGAPFAERKEPLFAWLSYFVVFLAVVVGMGSRRRRLLLIKVMVGASVLVSLLAISQRFGLGLFYSHLSPEYQVTSTLGNPMYVGAYLVLVLPLALLLVTFSSTLKERLVWILISLVTVVALVLALNRGSWLGAAVGALVLLVASLGAGLTRQQKRQVVIAFVLLIAAGLIVTFVFQWVLLADQLSVSERIVSGLSSSSTFNKRVLMWDSGVRMIGERPLRGWGLDTFRDTYPRYQQFNLVKLERYEAKTVDQPHNQILYVAYAFGGFGLISYLWLVLASMAAMWRSMGTKFSRERRNVAIGLLAAVSGYLAQSMFSTSVTGVTPLFFVVLALGVAEDGESAVELRLSQTRRSIILLLTGFVALVLTFQAVVPALADYIYGSGQRKSSGQGGVSQEPLSYYRRAIALNPWEGKYRFTYAQLSKELSLQSGNSSWAREAIPIVSEGLDRDSQSYDLYFALGHLYYTISQVEGKTGYGEAKKAYGRSVVLAPFFADAHVWLGMSYLQEGDPVQAVATLKRALSITPKTWQAWDGLGQAYDRLGRREDAIRAFRRVLQLNPGYGPTVEDL